MQGQGAPDKGEITIDGEKLLKVRDKVALMPQRSSMNWKFPITVERLVALGQIKKSRFGKDSPFQIKELISNPKTWINKCCEVEAAMQRELAYQILRREDLIPCLGGNNKELF